MKLRKEMLEAWQRAAMISNECGAMIRSLNSVRAVTSRFGMPHRRSIGSFTSLQLPFDGGTYQGQAVLFRITRGIDPSQHLV